MPEITELTVSHDRKVQLSQFEPITYGVEFTVALEEDEDAGDVYHEAALDAQDMVDREIVRRITEKKQTSDE